MDDFVKVVWAIAVGIVCLWLLPWTIYFVVRVMSAGYGAISVGIGGSFQTASTRFANWQAQRSILDQASRSIRSSRLRRESATGKTDPEVYALAALLTKAVSNCNMMHHHVADALGVIRMDELQDHAVCAAYRERVIQITDTALNRLLQTDVVSDPTAAKMLVGLDQIQSVCVDCMLLGYMHDRVPKLCSPASSLGCTGKEQE